MRFLCIYLIHYVDFNFDSFVDSKYLNAIELIMLRHKITSKQLSLTLKLITLNQGKC